jgi:hypothetical protein
MGDQGIEVPFPVVTQIFSVLQIVHAGCGISLLFYSRAPQPMVRVPLGARERNLWGGREHDQKFSIFLLSFDQ